MSEQHRDLGAELLDAQFRNCSAPSATPSTYGTSTSKASAFSAPSWKPNTPPAA